MIYDGLKASGSEVVNVINKFKNEAISIQVTTKKGTTFYNYTLSNDGTALGGSGGASIKQAQEVTSATYINPNEQFLGVVVRDVNNTIIGIAFYQQT